MKSREKKCHTNPLARYELKQEGPFSAYSRPRRDHADGSYEIHLVKATDPYYIPGEMEIWPIFHDAISEALEDYPEAAQAAVEACCKVQKEYQGRKNRDL